VTCSAEAYWLTAAKLMSAAFTAAGAIIPRATGASISCLIFIEICLFCTKRQYEDLQQGKSSVFMCLKKAQDTLY
jgi:hypothetical protein